MIYFFIFYIEHSTIIKIFEIICLSLVMPVRFAQGEYARMDENAAELKSLLLEQKDWLLDLLMQEKQKVDEELKAQGGGHI